ASSRAVRQEPLARFWNVTRPGSAGQPLTPARSHSFLDGIRNILLPEDPRHGPTASNRLEEARAGIPVPTDLRRQSRPAVREECSVKAVRFTNWKTFPEIKDVPRPVPGPGEVLLKIAGAGACHSDVAVFETFDENMGVAGQLGPEYTLGHENSGWIEEIGEGVTGLNIGDAFLAYGPIGCGHCAACSRGQDTYCANAATQPYLATGLGRDGGMAEYMTVPARNLVPLGDADPVAAAPLSDAGLTPYHAIRLALPKLAGGGRFALVIGLGGLGQIAVQILRALTGATILATDTKAEAMRLAEAAGAVTVPAGADQVEHLLDFTGGRGVDAAFDFVGVTATLRT